MKRGFLLLSLLFACASGPAPPAPPAPLDTANETCQWCRMTVSEPRLAAQIVAPLEEPRFFDDIGCMRDYLASAKSLSEDAMAYVADHRTSAWVSATQAVYTKVPTLETPMKSHLVAHVDTASRDQDPSAGSGATLTARDVFGSSGPPGARP